MRPHHGHVLGECLTRAHDGGGRYCVAHATDPRGVPLTGPFVAASRDISDSLVTPAATTPMLVARMFFISASASGCFAASTQSFGSKHFSNACAADIAPNVI